MSSVAVIDYGMGNLHSVAKALEHVQPGIEVRVTADHDAILNADRVILPGVGAIRDCMGEIRRLGVDSIVREVIESGKPFLAICIGIQALMAHSEENGGVDCLDYFPGNALFFGTGLTDDNGDHLKVPHMGWNRVWQQRPHPLWNGMRERKFGRVPKLKAGESHKAEIDITILQDRQAVTRLEERVQRIQQQAEPDFQYTPENKD